jgi:predicted secreted Zn-dependent protease
MRKQPCTIVALFVILLLTACSDADREFLSIFGIGNKEPITAVIPNARMDYYTIYGSTAEELRQSLNESGPGGYDAYTGWYVNWSWPGYGGDQCQLTLAALEWDLYVTFPSWSPPWDASQELIDEWTQYVNLLAAHETVHVNNFLHNYSSILTAIQRATCTTAEERARDAVTVLQRLDDAFDEKTNHGATQGAVFP